MNGKGDLVIRKAISQDSQGVIEYLNIINKETDFLILETSDVDYGEEGMSSHIYWTNSCLTSVLIIALIDDIIVGLGSIFSDNYQRTKHIGQLGLSVRKDYWGIGIGHIMMDSLLNWCKDNGITTKINLAVREDNERAIHLYEKFGFVKEGLLSRDFLINGVYHSSYQMGLEI